MYASAIFYFVVTWLEMYEEQPGFLVSRAPSECLIMRDDGQRLPGIHLIPVCLQSFWLKDSTTGRSWPWWGLQPNMDSFLATEGFFLHMEEWFAWRSAKNFPKVEPMGGTWSLSPVVPRPNRRQTLPERKRTKRGTTFNALFCRIPRHVRNSSWSPYLDEQTSQY